MSTAGGIGLRPWVTTAGRVGGILAVTSTSPAAAASATALYFYNGHGNVANLVDTGTAATVATYEYSPFGKTLVAHGPLADANSIRFSTKYAGDMERPGLPSGPELDYYGYRHYSPELGRWRD